MATPYPMLNEHLYDVLLDLAHDPIAGHKACSLLLIRRSVLAKFTEHYTNPYWGADLNLGSAIKRRLDDFIARGIVAAKRIGQRRYYQLTPPSDLG